MRVGVIGLGQAGLVHLQAWQKSPVAQVVAACDPHPAARQRAQDAGVTAYPDVVSMLGCEQLDAVSICTPPSDHVNAALACLRHGVHALCEKPLALTTRDATLLLRAADRWQRQLLLATKFRHVAALNAARDLIHRGAIGEPVGVEVSFCSPVDMSGRWNSRPHHSGGGVIIDNGCHAFDIIAYLFGSITRVHASVLKPIQRLKVEDSAAIQVIADGGVLGRIDLSWSFSRARDTYVVVQGSQGVIEIGWSGARVRFAGRPEEAIAGPYEKASAHLQMVTWFAEVVAGTRPSWIGMLDCLQTVAAVDAAYRSVQSGRWEYVDIQADMRANGNGHAEPPTLLPPRGPARPNEVRE